MDLIDIYRTLHPRTTEYSFFSNTHGTFSRIDHILGHKTGLNRYQKTEIMPCVFSDHNTLKLALNHKEKFGRNSNTWKLRAILLKNDWVNQEIKEELKQFMETNENENTSVQNLWDTAKVVLGGNTQSSKPYSKEEKTLKCSPYTHTLNSWRWNKRTGLCHT